MSDVSGDWDARFQPVRDALAEQLEVGDELGAGICVDIDGRTVVDIWGGWRDTERRSPWARDTITNVWSTTKTVTNLAALMLIDRGRLDAYAPVADYWPEFAAERQGADRGPAPAQPHLRRVRVGRPRSPYRTCTTGSARPSGWPHRPRGGSPDLHRGITRPTRATSSVSSCGACRARASRASSPTRSPARSAPTSRSARSSATGDASLRRGPAPPLPDRLRGARPRQPDVQDVHRPRHRRQRRQHPRLARRRHGRGQRARQRALGCSDHQGAGPRRRRRRNPAAVPGDHRADLRRAEPRSRPGPHRAPALRDRVCPAGDRDRPLRVTRTGPATGVAGAAR